METQLLLSCFISLASLSWGQIEFRSILIDEPGTDEFSFFEIYGSPNELLTSVWFLEIDGDGTSLGTIDKAIDLTSYSLGANGLLLYRDNSALLPLASPQTTVVDATSFDPENGDLTFLLVENFTGSEGDDLDTNNDGILDILPWGTILDAIGVDETNSDPDIAANLGFEVINDNGGLSGFSEAGFIFSNCSHCSHTNSWRGAVVEVDPESNSTFRIADGAWFHDGPSGIDCFEDSERALTPGHTISPLRSTQPDLSTVDVDFCEGDYLGAYSLPNLSNNGINGHWEDEMGLTVTEVNTNNTGTLVYTFIVDDAGCYTEEKITFTIYPIPNTTEIDY